LRRPEVTSVITGATKPEQVDDNVAAADLDVDPRVLAELDRVLEPVAPFEAYTS
jgi:aryl-alcohol dehydrogenase-like predicted oxidoreductase